MSILLYSSHGQALFDEEGVLLKDELDPSTYPVGFHPFKLDVKEWKSRYPTESPQGEWDILDWSYTTRNGTVAKYVDTMESAL